MIIRCLFLSFVTFTLTRLTVNLQAKSFNRLEKEKEDSSTIVYPRKLLNESNYNINNPELEIEIEILGNTYTVVIVPSKNLINKHATIEYIGDGDANYRLVNLNRSSLSFCYYQGIVKSVDDSCVALSVCNGLVKDKQIFLSF